MSASTRKDLEADIERFFVKQVTNKGHLVMKLNSRSANGMPDRLVLADGKVYFVELKRPGGKPRPLQISQQNKLKRHGGIVFNLSTREEVLQFIEQI